MVFVASPIGAPAREGFVYARPDDVSDTGESWRERLRSYNANPGENPLTLRRAADLYLNPIYNLLVHRIGWQNVYILSAGWGIVRSGFLTPMYDVTFGNVKKEYEYKKEKQKILFMMNVIFQKEI